MTTKPTTGQAVHGGGQPMNPGSQPMNAPGQPHNPGPPINPAAGPGYARGPAPASVGSRFKRFLFNVFLVLVAFAAGYFYMERESQDARAAMEREQSAALDRIAALEERIEELSREAGTRVELDLTEVFEPIREALSQVTLVKLGEISEQITAELVRVVETDLAVDLGAAGAAAAQAAAAAEQAADEAAEAEAAAAETPAPESEAPERAEAPAAEPSTRLPADAGDEAGLAGAAALEPPPAGPDVSWNTPPAAEPLREEAPVSDLVALLAQYEPPTY